MVEGVWAQSLLLTVMIRQQMTSGTSHAYKLAKAIKTWWACCRGRNGTDAVTTFCEASTNSELWKNVKIIFLHQETLRCVTAEHFRLIITISLSDVKNSRRFCLVRNKAFCKILLKINHAWPQDWLMIGCSTLLTSVTQQKLNICVLFSILLQWKSSPRYTETRDRVFFCHLWWSIACTGSWYIIHMSHCI